MGQMLLPTSMANIVYGPKDLIADVPVIRSGRRTANVGTRAHNRLLETIAQLARKRLTRDPQRNTPVLANQTRRQVDGTIKDKGGRFLRKLQDVPSHIRHISDITLQPRIRINKANHRLGIVALLDFINTAHRRLVGGITTNSPNRISGIKNYTAAPQYFNGIFNIIYLLQNAKLKVLSCKDKKKDRK